MSQHYCAPVVWIMLRALRKTGLLYRLNFSVSMVFEGKRLKVPVNGGIGLGLLTRDEPWMAPLLRALLTQFPGVFLDVGVNVGQTLCKVKAIDPARVYWGAEPNPVCVHYSQELIRLHGYTDVTLVPVGLSDRDGLLELELHNENLDDSSATMVDNFRPNTKVHRTFIIPVLRFGNAAKGLGGQSIGVVKIDVEGGEREVLLGMEERIRSDRPAVVLEILPVGDRMARLPRQEEVERLFSRNAYVLHRIGYTPSGITLRSIDGAVGIHHDQSLSNYVALPKETVEATLNKLGIKST